MSIVKSFNINGLDSSLNLASSTEDGLMSYDSYNKIDELEQTSIDNTQSIDDISIVLANKVNIVNSNETVIVDNSSLYAICDQNGNIAMKITNDGFSTRKIMINDSSGNVLNTIDENTADISEIASKTNNISIEVVENTFSISDRKGYIGFIVNSDGTVNFNGNSEKNDTEIMNKIALPAYLYCLDGVQRNFWHQSLLARWNPYDYYLQFSGTATYQRRTNLVASIKSGNSDGNTITTKLFNLRTMTVDDESTSYLRVGTPNDSALAHVNVQFIGSSTVQLCYFEYALTNYVSNYTLVGIRHKANDISIMHEGRGGASLESLSSISTGSKTHYYPFWQPTNYRYFGATDFWKLAITNVNSESLTDGTGAYYNGLYNESVVAKFDSSTGYLLNPSDGDIMYDSTEAQFKVYSSSSWTDISSSALTWDWDYGKYIDMWELDTPDIICISLGSNDFRNSSLPVSFDIWNEKMESLITSIHAKNSTAKIVLCNQGPFMNYGIDGANIKLQNYIMWLHLQDIISVFGNREDEGIYVISQNSEISSEYGGNTYESTNSIIMPTEIMDTTETMKLNTDTVHPYKCLNNMGTPIAAFIQYIRK